MGLIGYIVSIPVFADSGFVILSSLNRALTKKAKLSLAGTAIALSLGLTASHTMVPPTPGPIAAAGIIGADLGLVILFGLCTSIFGLFISILFSKNTEKKYISIRQPMINCGKQKHSYSNYHPSVLKSFLAHSNSNYSDCFTFCC